MGNLQNFIRIPSKEKKNHESEHSLAVLCSVEATSATCFLSEISLVFNRWRKACAFISVNPWDPDRATNSSCIGVVLDLRRSAESLESPGGSG